MNEELQNHPLKTVFSSREISNSPLIPLLIKIINQIKESRELDESTVLLSARFGRRIIINALYKKSRDIKPDDFIEMIDYNFQTNTLIIIGAYTPSAEVLYHWLVQYAKKEISFILEIKDASFAKSLETFYPNIRIPTNKMILDTLALIMKSLQKDNILIINASRILITASTIDILKKRTDTLIQKWRQTQ
jgi:hypothetical protein